MLSSQCGESICTASRATTQLPYISTFAHGGAASALIFRIICHPNQYLMDKMTSTASIANTDDDIESTLKG
jgi:hypothetical protein